jgi:threonine/homoserine/homoserine lactone efflux protein
MQTEKVLCWLSMIVAGLVVLTFLVDLILGMPFGRASLLLDILFVIGAAFVLWQGIETNRELR